MTTPPAPPSPTPWTAHRDTSGHVWIQDANGDTVAGVDGFGTEEQDFRNVALIVEAVNTHATLLERCDKSRITINALMAEIETLATQLAERSRQRDEAIRLLRLWNDYGFSVDNRNERTRNFLASMDGAVTP